MTIPELLRAGYVTARREEEAAESTIKYELAILKKDQDGNVVLGKDGEPEMVATKIPHNFRRTAVRRLERAGVSRSVAMELVGHRTQSIYDRYAIVSEQDLREGVEKLANIRDATEGVLPLPPHRKQARSDEA